jgi:2'-5' RNA ligase
MGSGRGVLVIYSKLVVSDGDREWIEEIRRAHDPQHSIVPAHFTFVFPFAGTPVDDAIAHAAQVAGSTAPIPFRLTNKAVVKDAVGTATHLFLTPGDGSDQMRALHAQLYASVLARHLNTAISFLPHVTVGAFERHEDGASVAGHLGVFDITGELSSLIVAEFNGSSVTELRELRLRG